jgi:hypothetical protein
MHKYLTCLALLLSTLPSGRQLTAQVVHFLPEKFQVFMLLVGGRGPTFYSGIKRYTVHHIILQTSPQPHPRLTSSQQLPGSLCSGGERPGCSLQVDMDWNSEKVLHQWTTRNARTMLESGRSSPWDFATLTLAAIHKRAPYFCCHARPQDDMRHCDTATLQCMTYGASHTLRRRRGSSVWSSFCFWRPVNTDCLTLQTTACMPTAPVA